MPHAPVYSVCAGTVHYYQGLHDVASVLLLVAGEPAAFDMLCQLSTGHLRDATRSSLDPVIELLGLMGPIVAAADDELANYLSKQGLPPFYALSWFITWFSHDLADFGEVIVVQGRGGSTAVCGAAWAMCGWQQAGCWLVCLISGQPLLPRVQLASNSAAFTQAVTCCSVSRL